jgi:hypothetical protein
MIQRKWPSSLRRRVKGSLALAKAKKEANDKFVGAAHAALNVVLSTQGKKSAPFGLRNCLYWLYGHLVVLFS